MGTSYIIFIALGDRLVVRGLVVGSAAHESRALGKELLVPLDVEHRNPAPR